MTRYNIWAVTMAAVLMAGLSCGDDGPQAPRTGTVVVSVNDDTVGPVPDVEVRLAGTDQVGTTDREGKVVFHVASGSYFVDAKVCCIGPGWLVYHEPVRIQGGKTAEVELRACLDCV